MLLEINGLTKFFGCLVAVYRFYMQIFEGNITGLIGPNGAGKSTILRTVSRLKPLTSGNIFFRDKRINNMDTPQIVKLGVVHIPEGRRLFPYLSVLANLKLGASLRKDKAGINRDINEIMERFPVLRTRRNQKAVTLSGGEQQMLAIGRGLMAKPALLMLDEPSIGLSPLMVINVARIAKDINQRGVTVLLVEQNVSLAFGVAERGYALQVGRVILEGAFEK